MPLEIEIKIRLNPEAAERLREQLGQPSTPLVREVNRLFDDGNATLATAGCGLRIREAHTDDGMRGILTYKGPKQPGPLKIREELETEVGDPQRVSEIFARLGYHERILYEKRRTTWLRDECEVTLDEMPRLGWFAEIEGPSEAAVTALLHNLKLDQFETIDESYVELTDREGDPTESGGRALTF